MKNNISKLEFDKLLNQSLVVTLAPETTDKLFPEISRQVFTTGTTPVMISNWALTATAIVSATLVGAVMFLNSNNHYKSDPGKPVKAIVTFNKDHSPREQDTEHQSLAVAEYTWRKPAASPKQQSKNYSDPTIQSKDSEPTILNVKPVLLDSMEKKIENEYIFPVLTEKEIKSNEKEKKRMIKLWSRVNREKDRNIARIPANADNSIPAFYMSAGEITNKEYRVFLFDLLINGRKEDFLKAKPNQHLWKNVENVSTYDHLEKEYFTEKKYDFFPVVNISVQGAELFCQWLQEEVAKIRTDDPRIPELTIRLPYENEWMHAAQGGTPNAMYAWPLNSAQNTRNCFMGNFCIQKKKDLIKHPVDYGKLQIDLNNYTSAAAVLKQPAIATIDVWSYNPTSYGMFGVCGNAAEMVYSIDRKSVLLKGGSWASDLEEIRLSGSKELSPGSSSPTNGFRISVFIKQ